MTTEPLEQAEDIAWAERFRDVNSMLNLCRGSEDAALLLSTCRNEYLTINALFVELQTLLGDARQHFGLRSGAELLIQGGQSSLAAERLERAWQTVRHYEHKLDVWARRHEIWGDVEQAMAQLREQDHLSFSRVRRVLTTTRVLADGDGWSQDLLRIELQDRPHLQLQWEALAGAFQKLRAATALGHAASGFLPSGEPTLQRSLELDDSALDVATNSKRVAELLALVAAVADMCAWQREDANGQRIVTFSSHYDRPRNAIRPKTAEVPLECGSYQPQAWVAQIGMLIRETMFVVHEELCRAFRPNTAKPDLPPPFRISLPQPVPSLRGSICDDLRIERIKCTTTAVATDDFMMVIAHLAVPVANLNGRTYRYKESSVIEQVKTDVRLAIREAKRAGSRTVIFPEYSVPLAMKNELLQLANDNDMVIVAGLEGDWRDSQLVDGVAVAIAGESRLHIQNKQTPSLEEEARASFYRDGSIKLFTNTAIGDFAVVVCSDFLERSVQQVWTPQGPSPEIVFVVARNKYYELYQSFATADAVRLYAAVAVANVRDGEPGEADSAGSCFALPMREAQPAKGTLHECSGTFLKTIATVNVPLHAIRARSRGKPSQGFLGVPQSAQRA